MFAPRLVALSFVSVSLVGPSASAQAPRPGGAPPPAVVSPEVGADRSIAFRLLAPKAQVVRLAAGDIPGSGRGAELKKNDQGVWEVKVGPVQPGTFRYRFNVDGVDVVDPRNPAVSESNALVWSLVHVPGEAYMDIQDVPHGAVAEVVYNSKSLGRVRRLHVYTPPGYETSSDRYP
ncbi:MAG TPA: esterase, partial [Planctomycetia bacterium]|nr:esterase [Planctomycetia bacterium]